MDAQSLPTVVLTAGEPAGIGPDIVLAVAQREEKVQEDAVP